MAHHTSCSSKAVQWQTSKKAVGTELFLQLAVERSCVASVRLFLSLFLLRFLKGLFLPIFVFLSAGLCCVILSRSSWDAMS